MKKINYLASRLKKVEKIKEKLISLVNSDPRDQLPISSRVAKQVHADSPVYHGLCNELSEFKQKSNKKLLNEYKLFEQGFLEKNIPALKTSKHFQKLIQRFNILCNRISKLSSNQPTTLLRRLKSLINEVIQLEIEMNLFSKNYLLPFNTSACRCPNDGASNEQDFLIKCNNDFSILSELSISTLDILRLSYALLLNFIKNVELVFPNINIWANNCVKNQVEQREVILLKLDNINRETTKFLLKNKIQVDSYNFHLQTSNFH